MTRARPLVQVREGRDGQSGGATAAGGTACVRPPSPCFLACDCTASLGVTLKPTIMPPDAEARSTSDTLMSPAADSR